MVGWREAITVEETDEAVVVFLERLLSGYTVGKATGGTGLVFYPDDAEGIGLG